MQKAKEIFDEARMRIEIISIKKLHEKFKEKLVWNGGEGKHVKYAQTSLCE